MRSRPVCFQFISVLAGGLKKRKQYSQTFNVGYNPVLRVGSGNPLEFLTDDIAVPGLALWVAGRISFAACPGVASRKATALVSRKALAQAPYSPHCHRTPQSKDFSGPPPQWLPLTPARSTPLPVSHRTLPSHGGTACRLFRSRS